MCKSHWLSCPYKILKIAPIDTIQKGDTVTYTDGRTGVALYGLQTGQRLFPWHEPSKKNSVVSAIKQVAPQDGILVLPHVTRTGALWRHSILTLADIWAKPAGCGIVAPPTAVVAGPRWLLDAWSVCWMHACSGRVARGCGIQPATAICVRARSLAQRSADLRGKG